MNWLVEDKLEALANRNDGELPQDAEGNWNEIAAQSKEVLANIIEIDEKGGVEMNEEKQLEHFLQQLRSKFVSENGVSVNSCHNYQSAFQYVLIALICHFSHSVMSRILMKCK